MAVSFRELSSDSTADWNWTAKTTLNSTWQHRSDPNRPNWDWFVQKIQTESTVSCGEMSSDWSADGKPDGKKLNLATLQICNPNRAKMIGPRRRQRSYRKGQEILAPDRPKCNLATVKLIHWNDQSNQFQVCFRMADNQDVNARLTAELISWPVDGVERRMAAPCGASSVTGERCKRGGGGRGGGGGGGGGRWNC